MYEVTASRVSPSVQQRGASRSTDDACATSTSTAGHSTTTDNVTNSDSFCELCTLDRTRTVQSSGGEFSGTLGQDPNPNYVSVMRQPVPEVLSERKSHKRCPQNTQTVLMPHMFRNNFKRNVVEQVVCWEVTGVADHDLTQTGHKGETYDEMSSRDCHKLDTEYREEVSPAVFCTRGSANVDGVMPTHWSEETASSPNWKGVFLWGSTHWNRVAFQKSTHWKRIPFRGSTRWKRVPIWRLTHAFASRPAGALHSVERQALPRLRFQNCGVPRNLDRN